MQKLSVKNVKNLMGGVMLCLLVLAACQKKRISVKGDVPQSDPRVEQIRKNYENDANARQLGLKPDWEKAALDPNNSNAYIVYRSFRRGKKITCL